MDQGSALTVNVFVAATNRTNIHNKAGSAIDKPIMNMTMVPKEVYALYPKGWHTVGSLTFASTGIGYAREH